MTAVEASSSRGTVEEACNWVVITSTQVTSVLCHHVAPSDIAPNVWGCGVSIGHLYQPIYVAPSDHHYQGVATPGCRFYQADDTAI